MVSSFEKLIKMGCFAKLKIRVSLQFWTSDEHEVTRGLSPAGARQTYPAKTEYNFSRGAAFSKSSLLSSSSQQLFSAAFLSSLSQQLFSAAFLSLSQLPFSATFLSSFSQQFSSAAFLRNFPQQLFSAVFLSSFSPQLF